MAGDDAKDEPLELRMSGGLQGRRNEERDARAEEIDRHLAVEGAENRAAAWRRFFSYVVADVEVIVVAVGDVQRELAKRMGGLKKGPEVAAERRKKEAKERELKIEQAVAKLFTENPLVLNKQIAAHLDENQVAILGERFYEPSTTLEFAKKFGAKQRASMRSHKK